MSELERLERAVSGLLCRVERLEARPAPSLPECCQAQAVAVELGLDPKIVCRLEQGDPGQRCRLIRELRRRQWAVSAIARALGCCERTVWRAVRFRGAEDDLPTRRG